MEAGEQMNNELYSTAGDYGLRTLVDPNDSTADIVFVHGLTGNRESTWSHEKTLWPETLLPKELGEYGLQARIITFGYDANVVGMLETAGSNRLRDHGKSLAEDLALRRWQSRTSRRPLIFVVHSMGGLVCEQALLISRGSAEPHVQELLEATRAIAFLGTPHHGSQKAEWTKTLRNISNIFRETNQDLLRVLEPGSEMLAALQQEFHVMLNARQKAGKNPPEIFCFYEEVKVLGVGWIVPPESAILASYSNQAIHANHMNMTKYSKPNDAGFKAVSGRICLWLDPIKTELQEQENPRIIKTFGRGTRLGSQHFGNVNSGGGPVIQGSDNIQVSGR